MMTHRATDAFRMSICRHPYMALLAGHDARTTEDDEFRAKASKANTSIYPSKVTAFM